MPGVLDSVLFEMLENVIFLIYFVGLHLSNLSLQQNIIRSDIIVFI